MGGWLFGKGNPNTSLPATRLRVQTSIQGTPKTIVWGQTRIAGNLIDYLDFRSFGVQQQGGGGKGGIGGVGGKGGAAQTNYIVTPVIGLCEGPINGVVAFWADKSFQPASGGAGWVEFNGSYSQAPWSYLTSAHPGHDLNYRGLAYLGQPNTQLGTSPELPQYNWEIQSVISFAYGVTAQPNTPPDLIVGLYGVHGYPPVLQGSTPITPNTGLPDANPRDVIVDFLTNTHYGVGWPSGRLDLVMNDYSSACLALGLVISPALTDAKNGNAFLQEIADATHAGFRWSNGMLTLVPWYDQSITSGQQSNLTETHTIPAAVGTSYVSSIQIGLGGFVADLGVEYHGSGTPLTKIAYTPSIGLPGLPGSTGNYTVSPSGLYWFSAADAGASVDITYTLVAQASYQPYNTPIYDINLDLLPNQGTAGAASGNQPIVVVRNPSYFQYNVIKLEWLDRNNNYDPSIIEAKDQASIDTFVLRARDLKQSHMFCVGASATISSYLQLIREKIPNVYTFTVGPQYILLEVEDIVTLTRPVMGLNAQPVRITEIQENEDGSLTITAEEYLGTVSPPLYNAQLPSGIVNNYNADPGSVNDPWIFEPPAQAGTYFTGSPNVIVVGLSGVNTAVWGGAFVWVSLDGNTYANYGTITGASRMGVTTADLPIVTPNAMPNAPTIDTTNTLSVDLTESLGALQSGSAQDLVTVSTLVWVGNGPGNAAVGELMSYQNAALTGTNKYDLTTLNRGQFGSAIIDHPTGSPFLRIDGTEFYHFYDPSLIGFTIYIKFQSFNHWGGGIKDLSQIGAESYVVQGAALSGPLPQVQNVRAYFEAAFAKIYWDEVSDFRTGILYEIRKGTSWDTAVTVGLLAHPPFIAFGNDTFWIKARVQPGLGVTVYSGTASSITIAGNTLVPYTIKSWDEEATGWTGTVTGCSVVGSNVVTSTGVMSGTYEVPSSHWIDVGYVVPSYMNASYKASGAPVGQNILSYSNILAQPNLLSTGSAQNVTAHLDIAIASTLSASTSSTAATVPFIPAWSSWQSFVPGVYNARYSKMRAAITSNDISTTSTSIGTQAYLFQMSWSAQTQPRIDHYNNIVTSTTAGTVINWTPDGSTVSAPFNMGPNGSSLPYVVYTVNNGTVPGDFVFVESFSSTGVVFDIGNVAGSTGSSAVRQNRSVSIAAEGA